MYNAPVLRRNAIATACLVLTASAALAQTDTPEAQLETVQVTGNWLGSGQRSVKNFGGARTVVKRDDFQLTGADSISDVLRSVPGVQITDNSSSGGSAISLNIGVRGLEGRYSPRSTILLDGVPLSVAPYGQPQLSFAPVSLANIDAIDVVRGGGAVRYGPQNVGGIINFKTRAIPERDTAMDASVRYNKYDGGNSSTQASAFVGGRIDGGLGIAMMYSGLEGDGPRAHNRDKVNDFALKFSYPLTATSEVNAKFSYFDAWSDTPGGLTREQYEADAHASFRTGDFWRGHRKGLDVSYINTLSDTREVEVRAYFNQSFRQSLLGNGQDKALTQFANSPRHYNVGAIEPRYTERFTWGGARHDVTAGYRYLQERADEKNINFKLADSSRTETRNSENSTDAHAIYVDDQIAFGQWRVTPGLRFEDIKMGRYNVLTKFDQEISNTKALPSVNVAYLLDKATTLYANYNTSFGSIQHLQLNLQSSADTLQPETAKTVELGARYAANGWQLDATLFNLDFSNQIVFVNTAPVFYQNLGKTRHRGIESRAEYAFGGKLNGLSVYGTYAYTKATQGEGKYAGNDVPFYSRIVDTAGARYKIGNFVADLSSTHQSKQYADDANTVTENASGSLGLIRGYRLWNASVTYVIPGDQRFEIQAGATNLANKKTYTRTTDTNLGMLPGAPRMAYVNVRTAF
ncbi:TonB-dependent siderophore receptor [Pseudoduganella ginsengisoli]|uniref:TonB-dependent siderophore receptor n=1 Tax=Pseudoduganella ginsengisoli TaxID=1462440 RepID=A0A6L6Q201_9BURK|nr:TonB-dependent siderophore receptor [Pseudoduganella ginsengisoli]MTW03847.1 TonB-dependent siderophore receptor [Pseudoduganella ginsengisoli]